MLKLHNTIRNFAALAALTLICAAAPRANAQWRVVYLHPPGVSLSQGYGVADGLQAGWTTVGGNTHAARWSGNAASWLDLNPAGASDSGCLAAGDGQQAGWAVVGGSFHAACWSGTAASWVDLNPAGSRGSQAYGVSGGQQVGIATVIIGVGGNSHASLWRGTAASWVDLHPFDYFTSGALGVGDGQQVGYTISNAGVPAHAALWSGDAASRVDLHPPGAGASQAFDTSDGQQVGHANFPTGGYRDHAVLWRNTPESWVDLHPAGAYSSQAYAVEDGQQVGWTYFQPSAGTHAALWNNTADSRVDLHAFLTAEFTTSEARAIWHEGETTYVVGFARNGVRSRNEAVMWVMGPANSPPVATDDFYGMNQAGSLSVPSPGILANDSDADEDPLTVELVTGPANAASFQLNPDGSFSYAPSPFFYGEDAFTYKASDGTEDSDTVTVHITVSQPGSQGFITGGGKFFQDGRKCTFGFVAKVLGSGVQGQLEFQDHEAGMDVKAQLMQWVYSPNPREGSFAGTCSVNGVEGYTFFVQVHDQGQPGNNDDLTIWVFDFFNYPVYTAGALLTGGNIVIHGN